MAQASSLWGLVPRKVRLGVTESHRLEACATKN